VFPEEIVDPLTMKVIIYFGICYSLLNILWWMMCRCARI